ncbi:hypothetical protein JAAARDRAFT_29131 [Jaapia argillacea MUCL 33604]|uniref:2,5-diamino-6-ribosylamino-4(3H)-pyrimidinone 5'-phosphate reductase n=1 Tax=Jaapia argillacea MUCL 33604 TaxID=933084 RepID=A0A067QAC3_9AGAM|nr:hypothetical protein JAAARDRAFT_29131 [Jaapia argillacea MUCL 33604]
MHDGIMVGIGTALNDDPQLNTRHLPTSETPYHIPRPIILDSSLRLSPHCKVLKNFAAGTGRRPWIMCSLDQLHCHHSESGPGRADRKKALQEAGARVIEVSGSDGLLSITDVLRQLRNLGIHSLMVEGGARVIGSFLSEVSSSCVTDPATAQPYRDEGRGVVDMLVVTVAPTFVGDDGIGYGIDMSGNQVPSIEHVRTEVIGRDAVFAVRPKTGLVATT